MKLRPAELSDYRELVDMYIELAKVVYDGMKISEDAYFHQVVINWFKMGRDITICETKDGDSAGFTLAYKEDIGIIEPYYHGDIAYIKPEHRKSRAAYLLYNNVIEMGKQLGLRVIAKAFVGDGNKEKVDRLQGRFGEPRFIEYRTKD